MSQQMHGIAVRPLQPDSIHGRDDIPMPSIDQYRDGRGVKLKILQVGVCGTDREINEGLYGEAPPESDYLVLGHEALAQVVEVGPNVTHLKEGDIVSPTVRRPGTSRYDRMRFQDLTFDDVYFERGIAKIHGFLSDYVVEHEEYVVRIGTPEVAEIGVLMEPMSVVQKAVRVIWGIQEARLPFYAPQTALITGAGPIGQLAALVLRMRGLDVVVAARRSRADNLLKAELVEAVGGTYIGTEGRPLAECVASRGPFDIVIEATGSSRIAFDVLHLLSKNGVCSWTSITGGKGTNEVRTDEINQAAVLGNQLIFGSVNAHIGDFESGVVDFARGQREYPGWLRRTLSHRVNGLEDYENMIQLLHTAKEAVKIWVDIAKAEN